MPALISDRNMSQTLLLRMCAPARPCRMLFADEWNDAGRQEGGSQKTHTGARRVDAPLRAAGHQVRCTMRGDRCGKHVGLTLYWSYCPTSPVAIIRHAHAVIQHEEYVFDNFIYVQTATIRQRYRCPGLRRAIDQSYVSTSIGMSACLCGCGQAPSGEHHSTRGRSEPVTFW